MKTRTILWGVMLLPLLCAAAVPARAQTANPQDTLNQYLADLQKNPGDNALRGKIIALVQTMNPAPAIPEDAERHMVRGQAAFKAATNESSFKEAIAEFKQASLIAPWLGNIYYNLGLVQDKAGEYSDAIASLNLYLLASPGASDAKSVKNLIYEVEYRRDKAQMGQLLNNIIGIDSPRALALIDKGADLTVKDETGDTALFNAAINNRINLIGPLLDKGADIEAKNKYGMTPLMAAAANGYFNTAELLVSRGANVNATDNNGVTVLMYSVCGGVGGNDPNFIRELIDKGANVNAKNVQGLTALMNVEGSICRKPEIAQILREAGAR